MTSNDENTLNSSFNKPLPSSYGKFYLSQGFKKKGGITNDCGPACTAMALNIVLVNEENSRMGLRKENIIHQTNYHIWHRVPPFFPRIGGATAPWGMVYAFNQWAKKLGISWEASRISFASRHDLVEQLLQGRVVSALKFWKKGGAHWVNILEINSEENMVYFLDPDPMLIKASPEKRVRKQAWKMFEEDWNRRPFYAYLLGICRELVVYSQTN